MGEKKSAEQFLPKNRHEKFILATKKFISDLVHGHRLLRDLLRYEVANVLQASRGAFWVIFWTKVGFDPKFGLLASAAPL